MRFSQPGIIGYRAATVGHVLVSRLILLVSRVLQVSTAIFNWLETIGAFGGMVRNISLRGEALKINEILEFNLQLRPEIPGISTDNTIYGMYNPIEITSYKL